VRASEPQQESVTNRSGQTLNPTTNPLLAQHLGRWAEAYFTNPPEKREQAVLALLQELTNSQIPDLVRSDSHPPSSPPPPLSAEASCPTCGHPAENGTRYCGICGRMLKQPKSSNSVNSNRAEPTRKAILPGLARNGTSRKDESKETSNKGLEENSELRSVTPLRPVVGIIRDLPVSRHLRGDLVRAFVGIAAIGLILLTPAYLLLKSYNSRSRRAPIVTRNNQSAVIEEARSSPASAQPASNPVTLATTSNVPPTKSTKPLPPQTEIVGNRLNGPSATTKPAATVPPKSAITTATTISSPVQTPENENQSDAQDFYRARKLLNPKNPSRDPAEAAKLLWKAVAKGNTEAALLLADLYQSGDGVSKSCDQARLILTAAANNSGAASQKLKTLDIDGCQ
jgi:uncharacterized Zn finger protein (UPF0148 family)